MLKTSFVVLLAIAMSIGVAQARHVRVIPGCVVGAPTAWKCNCGTAAAPLLCQRGQWCHPSHVMAEGPGCGA